MSLGLSFGVLEGICVVAIRVSPPTINFVSFVRIAINITTQPSYRRGVTAPMYVIAIFSQALYVLGLVPPYIELWRRKGRVIGFSWIFFGIDIAGAFFSLLALVAQHSFDLMGGLCYIFVLIMEIGICASHAVWLVRTRKIRAAARRVGMDYDSFVSVKFGEPTVGDRHREDVREVHGVERPATAHIAEKGGEVF